MSWLCLSEVCLGLSMFWVENGTGGRPPEGFAHALFCLLKTESPVDKIF